jgi:hypothetical protein
METRRASFSVGLGHRLEVNCDAGSVTVRDGPDGAVAVVTTLRNPEAWDYTAIDSGGSIAVTARLKPGFRRTFKGFFAFVADGPRADIEVSVPQGMAAAIVTSNATVDVQGLRNGCSVGASNGRVRLADCSGALRVETSNGATTLDRLAGEISVETSNGVVKGSSLSGSVDVLTSNGKVDLDLALSPGSENSVRTSNGSVTIGVANPAAVDVSVSTANGRTSVELPRAATGAGADRARLNVRTANGSVRVFESKQAAYV